jgi:hypothetical protein
MGQLLDGLGEGFTLDSFRTAYEADLAGGIQCKATARDANWTESLAVGSKGFVEQMQVTIKNRQNLVIEETKGREPKWCLREREQEYA